MTLRLNKKKKTSKKLHKSIKFPSFQNLTFLLKSPILQLGEMGYCFKCKAVKVPRAHHCKQCKR